MTSENDEFMHALHVITNNLGDNIDSLKLEDLKEMLSFTKMYYNNRSAFRAQVIAQDFDQEKGRNHLIKTVRSGNVAWAKRIIQVLDTLDSFTLESSQFMGKECYICYEPFEENHIVYKVPCNGNHIFHANCINKWTNINSTCPYCRDEINIENITGFLNKQSGTGKTVLYYAIKLGNQAFVEELINKGALVGYNDAQPIHLAAGFSHQELVAYFLAKGMSIESLDGVGRTPLYYAARYGKESIITYLLNNGAKFQFKYYDEHRDCSFTTNALLVALDENNKNAYQYLLSHLEALPEIGSINDEDSHKKTALFYAVKMHNLDLIVHIVEAGADLKKHMDEPKCHPLWRAVSTPERIPTIFYFLLEKMRGLFMLSEHEQQFLSFLSEVLVECCMCHKLQFVNRLLSLFNLKIDSACYNYLGAREGSGSQKVYDELKSLDNYKKLLETPEFFLECVRQNNIDMAEICLKAKNQKDFVDDEGNSAVHCAKSLEMFELLADYDFDFTLKNKKGCTLIHTFIGCTDPEDYFYKGFEKKLIFPLPSRNVDEIDDDDEEFVAPAPPIRRNPITVRRVVPYRRPPPPILDEDDEVEDHEPIPVPKKLKYIMKKKIEERDGWLKFLVKKGADINELDNNGLSPLHYAVLSDNKKGFLDILLDNGANINECSKNMSPLHMAMVKFHQSSHKYDEKNLTNIIRLLIEKGADVQRLYDEATVAHLIMHNYYHFNKDHLPALLKCIKDNGGDLNAYDIKQRTPLSLVLESNHFGFQNMEELEFMTKDCGLNLNTLANFGGNTLEYPLHWAVRNIDGVCCGNWETRIPEMMKYGADPSLVDPAGKTALDYADKQPVKNMILRHLGRDSEVIEEPVAEVVEEEEEEVELQIRPVGRVTQEEADDFVHDIIDRHGGLDDVFFFEGVVYVGRRDGLLRIVGPNDN